MTILYHICADGDQGNLNKGYVGITDDWAQRFSKHFSDICDSPILKRAIAKYGEDIRFSLITEGSREEMLRLEAYLRPAPKGWNATAGGGNPPNLSGKVMSQAQKDKISASGKIWQRARKKEVWSCGGIDFYSKQEAADFFNVNRRTIKVRCESPRFPNWFRKPIQDVG